MRSLVTFAAAALFCIAFSPVSQAGEKHLVYLHGCCVKGKQGPIANDYKKIVQTLKDDGFSVFFELRTSNETDSGAQVQSYAAKVADHIQGLLSKGVAPQDITVSGYSLGAMTALVASGLISNPKVNYVLLAGCPVNANIQVSIDYAKVSGRVLSIVDNKDDKFGSCAGRLPNAAQFKEIALDSGEGHKVFRLTDDANLKLWKGPLAQWATGQ
jgi:hypothetical protein